MMKNKTKFIFILLWIASSTLHAKLPGTSDQNETNNRNSMPEWYNQPYDNGFPNQPNRDAYLDYSQFYNPMRNPSGQYFGNSLGRNAYGNSSYSQAPTASEIGAIFKSTEGKLVERVWATFKEAYISPIFSQAMGSLIAKLPQFSGFTMSNGMSGPLQVLPPQCDPYFLQHLYRLEQQRKL